MRTCIVAIIAFGLIACASAPPPPPVTAPTLAYVLPPVNPARYALADTSRIAIEAPGGRDLNTMIALQATADLGMHVDSAGMLASVRLQSVSGSFEAGGQVTLQVDSADTPSGAALVRMSGRGPDSTMHTPGMSSALTRVAGAAIFRNFFVRLPGRAIEPGIVWTDTLTFEDDGYGVRSTTRIVVSSSFQGDTTVGGRLLRVIASRLATVIEVQGVVDGMEVRQNLVGSGRATTLWDDARGLLVAREERSTASGTMDMPVLGTGAVPVQAHSHRVLTLLQ